MAYQMKGNKNPGSSYKNGGPGEELKNKGLMGPVDESDWWDGDSSKSTMLPEVEIGSDGSSKINFDSSTDKGIKTLYTGDRVGEGSKEYTPTGRGKGTGSLKRAPQKSLQDTGSPKNPPFGVAGVGFAERIGKMSTKFMQGVFEGISPSMKKTADKEHASKGLSPMIGHEGQHPSSQLTAPMYTKTRGNKTKTISEKRYGKLSKKLAKREAKGKKTRRTVSDDSMLERFGKASKNAMTELRTKPSSK